MSNYKLHHPSSPPPSNANGATSTFSQNHAFKMQEQIIHPWSTRPMQKGLRIGRPFAPSGATGARSLDESINPAISLTQPDNNIS